MSVISFELSVPVPQRLLNRIDVFKCGILSIEGIRISVISTKAYFHVLTWEDLVTLHRLNVDLGDHIPKIKCACSNWEQNLFIRRVQYASKKIRAKNQESLRGTL